MKTKKNINCDPGYCLYGAKTILPLLGALSKETEGVKTSSDIEYIHRCRVATRRIRAALPLYQECFSPRDFRKWNKKIRSVTKALGDARDKDVQINFLDSCIKKLSGNGLYTEISFFSPENDISQKSSPDSTTVISPINPVFTNDVYPVSLFQKISIFIFKIFKRNNPKSSLDININPVFFQIKNPLLPGLQCLKFRLEQDRKALQPLVIKEIEKMESAGTIKKLGENLHKIVVEGKIDDVDIHSPYAFEKSFYNISLKMEELFWFERFIRDPENKQQHHAMRIAAKRFRYTMESFTDLYNGALNENIKSIKKIQDLLGDIHDCDVWADFLMLFLEEEKERIVSFFGNLNLYNIIVPGIENLYEERINKRKELHLEFIEYWDELKEKKEWESIRKTISIPLQSSFHHLISSGEKEELRIALIGDVHANLPALEAVLLDAKERGATAILNTGDFVGYGAFPDEVISILRKNHIISVIGNYDISVLKEGVKKDKNRFGNRSKRLAMKWAYENISDENKLYLKSLPKYIRINLNNKSLYLTHGSPESIEEYINEETPLLRLKELSKIADSDIVISGHSHEPFAKEVNKKWFINTGSVGRPEDGDPRACYALLTFEPFSIYHIRVPYDIQEVDGIYRNNLPEAFARIYRDGKPLDIIKSAGDEQIQ
ncbi:MAG: CHAD domain-containing protein [Methanomicrobium sp.]|nr:CHAD domain-containing protein [Methanomicrobium sp.]